VNAVQKAVAIFGALLVIWIITTSDLDPLTGIMRLLAVAMLGGAAYVIAGRNGDH
jgi:hypothetical protein